MPETRILLRAILLGVLPISELRGALPYAFFNGTPMLASFLIAVLSNILIVPIVWLFLSTLNKLLLKAPLYRRFFEFTIKRAREKVSDKFSRYGYLGLMLFVGVPLPATGAWTGTIGAWVLGLDRKKTFIFVSLGVIISGIIVATLLTLGVGLNSIFMKSV